MINWEGVLTFYLSEVQWKSDKDDMVLGHLVIIPFPVLCKCRNKLKRAKITKNPMQRRLNYQIMERIKLFDFLWFFDFFDFFDFLINLEVTHTSYLNEGQWKTDKDDMVLGHMAINPIPFLFKYCIVLNSAKTTK